MQLWSRRELPGATAGLRRSALALAAALAYATLNHGDRLTIFPFSDRAPPRFGPVTGKGQVPVVLKYLQSISFGGHLQLEEAVHSFIQYTRGGLVLLLSDLLDVGELHQALELLPAPTWQVVVLHVLHREELKPSLRGDVQLVDAETGDQANYDVNEAALRAYEEALAAWRDDLETTCADHHGVYQLVASDWSLEQAVIPALRASQILVPI